MFWMINDADKMPPLMMADAGYDVWLGNNRGTRYGQAHTTMDKSEAEFWDFSFQDMGEHDTPAFIEYVLESTGQS